MNDVFSKPRAKTLETYDVLNAPGALRALEDVHRVVFSLGDLGETAVHFRLRITAEEIDIRYEVHQVHGTRTRGASCNLAKHNFAIRLPVPLHVGEASLEFQCVEHCVSHLMSAGEIRRVEVPKAEGLRA